MAESKHGLLKGTLIGAAVVLGIMGIMHVGDLQEPVPASRIAPPPQLRAKPPNYSVKICDDAYDTEKDYTDKNVPFINVKLKPGCFSGYVHLPKDWRKWRTQMLGDTESDWVSMWYAGWNGPENVMYNKALNNDPQDWRNLSMYLRVEGEGTLRFYRINVW